MRSDKGLGMNEVSQPANNKFDLVKVELTLLFTFYLFAQLACSG